MSTLQIILTTIGWVVPSILTFTLGYVINKIKKDKEVQEKKDVEKEEREALLIEAVKIILKREIREYYDEYSKINYCPVSIKSEVQEVYRIYSSIGGNGSGKLMFEALMELPDNNHTDSI